MKKSDWMILRECWGWIISAIVATAGAMLAYHVVMWIAIVIFLGLLARCVHRVTTNHPDIQEIHWQSLREYWKTKKFNTPT